MIQPEEARGPINSSHTRNGDFFLPTGGIAGVSITSSTKVRIQFMSSSRDQYAVQRGGYKVLRPPYAHGSEFQSEFLSLAQRRRCRTRQALQVVGRPCRFAH
ncbi:unnamed protein product [Urochloa humidicola]